MTGTFGLGVQNDAGQTLTEFCQENALVIASTLFQQHKRVKEEIERICLKLHIKKRKEKKEKEKRKTTNFTSSRPITSWQIGGKKVEVTPFLFL